MKLWKIKESSIDETKKELMVKRPLPQGRTEFEEWSDRIIEGALVQTSDTKSLKFALANMIMHVPATEDHKEDAYFIKQLRKSAANQVAHAMAEEIKKSYSAKVVASEESNPDNK